MVYHRLCTYFSWIEYHDNNKILVLNHMWMLNYILSNLVHCQNVSGSERTVLQVEYKGSMLWTSVGIQCYPGGCVCFLPENQRWECSSQRDVVRSSCYTLQNPLVFVAEDILGRKLIGFEMHNLCPKSQIQLLQIWTSQRLESDQRDNKTRFSQRVFIDGFEE